MNEKDIVGKEVVVYNNFIFIPNICIESYKESVYIYSGSIFNMPINIVNQVSSIKEGDLIEYTDSESQMVGVNYKTIKVKKHGTWLDNKVIFNDGDKTLVRNKLWLRSVNEEYSIWSLISKYTTISIFKK